MRTLAKQHIYNEYVKWYVLPQEEKELMDIKSEVAFSKVFDIFRKQVWVWKNRPEFKHHVYNALRSMVPDHLIKLYHSMYEKAMKNPIYLRKWFDLFSEGSSKDYE